MPLLLGWSVLTIYLLTLSPTINSFDSSEFITGAYTLGIIHAPGYPLYLILAHFATLVPNVSVPLAVNFLSALFATLCVVIVFFSSYYLTKSYLWSIASALILAFSNLFWSRAVVAEVYSLNGLFFALLVLLYMLFKDTKSEKYLFSLSLVAGLSMTHHTSVVLILPWLFICLTFEAMVKVNTPRFWVALILFLMPMSLYSYFPIREHANPQINYVRDYFNFIDLTSARGIYWMVSGQMFQQDMWGRSLAATFEQLIKLIRDLWLNFFGAGLILALIALFYFVKNKKPVGIVCLMAVLSILIFFSAYNVVDNREMIIPAMVLLAPFISVGGAMLETKLVGSEPKFPINKLGFFLIILITTMVVTNWTSVDRSNDWSAYKYAESVLEVVEPNSIIISQWTAATPLEYMIIVEGKRPDVAIFDRGLFSLGIRALSFECKKRISVDNCSDSKNLTLQEYIDQQMPTRPIYITEYDPALRSLYCLTSAEYLYRVLPLQACN